MYTAWGANPFQTTLNAEQHRARPSCAAPDRQGRHGQGAGRNDRPAGRCHLRRGEQPRADCSWSTSISIRPMLAEAAHLMLPAAHPGEMNLTSMNGERRMRLSERFMDPPGEAKAGLPDRRRHRQHPQGHVREGRQRRDGRALRRLRLEDRGGRLQRRLPPRRPAGRRPDRQPGRRHRPPGHLCAAAQGGQQRRAVAHQGSRRATSSIGTEMLYTDKFGTDDGLAHFKPPPWPGLPKPVAEQKAKYRFWINNGRINEHLADLPTTTSMATSRRERYPMAHIETQSGGCQGAWASQSGDIVEVHNDYRLHLCHGLPGAGHQAQPELHGVRRTTTA